MYHLRLAARAEKELAKLPQDIQRRARAFFGAIAKNPLIGKPLKGVLAGAYSVYIWPYRIVYAPFHKENTVIVLRVAASEGRLSVILCTARKPARV